MTCIDQRIILAYVQILLDFGAIRFKFYDRINQRPVSFQSAIPETAQGNKCFYAYWRYAKLCPNSNKRPRSMQWAYFRSHAWSAYQRVKINQGLLIDVLNHLLYAQRRVQISQGLSMDVPNHHLYAQRHVQISRGSRWTSLTISYTCSTAYKSTRDSWLTSLSISYTFYTRIATNEKQGAPDRRSIQLLLLSACTSPHIKSKGLHCYVL
jgi:hypothetical protein